MNNGVIFQAFEWYLPNDGKHYQRLINKVDELQKVGFSAVWLPPSGKANGGINDVGYGVYDLYDLGEFDQKGSICTKYGTKEEYLSLIKKLQEAGINVYADMVFNHRIGADACEKVDAYAVDANNRNNILKKEEIESWTIFNFPNRHNKYSSFTWNHECFDGVDFDNRNKQHNIYLLDDNKWDANVDSENGNYDYLMGADVDFNNPTVLKELDDYTKWFLETTHVDGFRMDACKHIKAPFFKKWLDTIRECSSKELFTVGEYWSADINALEKFLEDTAYRLSVFDVVLHYHFYEYNNANGNMPLNKIFDNTVVKKHPQHAVTFIENHDTQPGQALQTPIADWFKPIAYGCILLRTSGYPCVFYGDYYGNKEKGMTSFKEVIDKMLKIRKENLYGNLNEYFDDEDCIGWSYDGWDDINKGCAVIISDREENQKYMYVGKQHANTTFYDGLENNHEEVIIDENGWGLFKVNAGSISCWIRKGF